jgi:hypothetical protein
MPMQVLAPDSADPETSPVTLETARRAALNLSARAHLTDAEWIQARARLSEFVGTLRACPDAPVSGMVQRRKAVVQSSGGCALYETNRGRSR